MTRRLALAAMTAALAASGCGVNPYADPGPTATPRPPSGDVEDGLDPTVRKEAVAAERAAEIPATAAGTTPETTLRAAAQISGTWTSRTAGDQYRRLANMSQGDARDAFELAARQMDEDPQQSGAGLQSSAAVEALSLKGTGERRSGLVVTRERVWGDPSLKQLEPAYKVTLARLERREERWVITEWSPQA